jgi:hypothetical protein
MKKILETLFVLLFASSSVMAQFDGDNGCSPGVFSGGLVPAINGDQIRSTFQFTVLRADGTGKNCTGSLINQLVDGQPRQYFITARHCIHEGTNGAGPLMPLNRFRFAFNFQSNNGDNGNVPPIVFPVFGNRGPYPRFRYAFESPVRYQYESTALFNGGFGVDIAMLEILRPIPPHFNVAYAGWKSDALLGPSGVFNAPMRVVHHPRSDAKKYAETFAVSKTEDGVAENCRLITRGIDAFLNWLGIKSITETVCGWVDIPQYVVPVMTTGAISAGSSGSPFFTNGNRLFAITSATLSENDCVNLFPLFGKFKTAYANREVREPLNPGYNRDANLFGIDGRSAVCYDANPLRLSGNYFPARDYQPNNQVIIRAGRTIEAGAIAGSTNAYARFDAAGTNVLNPVGTSLEEGFLRIYSGADFVFTAEESIRLVDGFQVQAGATFSARIQSCLAFVNSKPIPPTATTNESLPPVLPAAVQTESSVLSVSPNPSRGPIAGNYQVRQTGAVSVRLLNVEGKILQTVVETTHQEPGTYPFQATLAGQPQGVYLIELQTQTDKIARRVLLQE